MSYTEEEFEKLKKEIDTAPVKYKSSLKFLENQTFKGMGEFWFVSAENNRDNQVEYSLKLKPKAFRVMISVGRPTMYLVCDVIFTKLDFENPKLKKSIQVFKEKGLLDRSWKRVSNLFFNAPDREFEKIKRLISMDDFSLLIDEIIVEDI